MKVRSCRRVGVLMLVAVMIRFVGMDVVAAQGLGGAGTVQGTVKDPTGGVMQAVRSTTSSRRSAARTSWNPAPTSWFLCSWRSDSQPCG